MMQALFLFIPCGGRIGTTFDMKLMGKISFM